MKQNITVEQLSELSEKAKKRLNQWPFRNAGGYPVGQYWLLSIGEMIEFLDEHMDLDLDAQLETRDSYHHLKAIIWNRTNELCDDLWEAVKKELEKDT